MGLQKTQSELHQFEEQARGELAALNEDLTKREKERDIALASSDAAHRHLNNFAASMKAIEPDIAGGADPQQRLIEQEQQRALPKLNGRPLSASRAAAKSKAGAPFAQSASAKAPAKAAAPKPRG